VITGLGPVTHHGPPALTGDRVEFPVVHLLHPRLEEIGGLESRPGANANDPFPISHPGVARGTIGVELQLAVGEKFRRDGFLDLTHILRGDYAPTVSIVTAQLTNGHGPLRRTTTGPLVGEQGALLLRFVLGLRFHVIPDLQRSGIPTRTEATGQQQAAG
jgi:hypothetical protein